MKRKKKGVQVLLFLLLTVPLLLIFVLFLKVNSLQKEIAVLKMMGQPVTEGDAEQAETKTPEEISRDVMNADGYGGILEEEDADLSTEVPEGKTAYLTFDDGPSANTIKILDILKEYDVKATFFVVGKTDSTSKEIYQRIVNEGHTLGMHSYSHRYSEIYSSMDAFKKDLNKIQTLLYRITGVESHIYRFPGGSSNSVSEIPMEKMIHYLSKNQIRYFDWNAASCDAMGEILPASKLVANTMNSVLRNDVSIVLMHDGSSYDTTVEALPEIIELLQENEVALLPIDESTEPIQHIEAE